MQFQVKLMNQTWENDKKKLVSGTILACLTQVRTANFFFGQKSGLISHYILSSAIIMYNIMKFCNG